MIFNVQQIENKLKNLSHPFCLTIEDALADEIHPNTQFLRTNH